MMFNTVESVQGTLWGHAKVHKVSIDPTLNVDCK